MRCHNVYLLLLSLFQITSIANLAAKPGTPLGMVRDWLSLPIEHLYAEKTTTSPANIELRELITLLQENESRLQSGSYTSTQQIYEISKGFPFLGTDEPIGTSSTETFTFHGERYKLSIQIGSESAPPTFEEVWAFDGHVLKSYSHTRKSGVIRRESGTSLQKPNQFRELFSPIGFSRKGRLSVYYSDVEEKFPGVLQLYNVQHPQRGEILVCDGYDGSVVFFDPTKNYSPIGQILFRSRPEGRIYFAWEWSGDKLVSGLWLPGKLHYTSFGQTFDKKWLRNRSDIITFVDWTVNEAVDDNLFDLKIPSTYHVNDMIGS